MGRGIKSPYLRHNTHLPERERSEAVPALDHEGFGGKLLEDLRSHRH